MKRDSLHNKSNNKLIINKLKIVVVTIFFPVLLQAQYYISDEDPSDIRWRQIKAETFSLVFDEQFEEQAQRIAAIMEYSNSISGNSLHQKAQKIPILVHNQSVNSNGMVTWAPRRMELYIVPPQDLYAQGWFEQLALHEGRHVAQMNRLNRFTTLLLNKIFWEHSTGLAAAQVPLWFMEGDAVVTETALSEAGRGRMPSFQMGWRSIALDYSKNYSFRKAVFGSYKDYVPNRYELGYLMVAYNRAKYGSELWENTLDRISRRIIFTPFLSSVKQQTGVNRTTLYRNTFDALRASWKTEQDTLQYADYKLINKRENSSFVSYSSPVECEGKIYAIKTSMDDIARIVSIDKNTGKEKVEFTPGTILSNRIQISNGLLYWEEYRQDVRWPQRSFSIIRSFNTVTGKSNNLTKKSRYFAPTVSPDGKTIAAIETDVKGNNSLVLLGASNGAKLEAFPVPENAAIQLPSWNEEGSKLVMTLVNTQGKALVEFDVHSKSWETLIEPASDDISSPVYAGKYFFFSAAYSGVDNIYAFDIESKITFLVSNVKTGAFYPNISTKTGVLYFNQYTSNGFDVNFMGVDTSKWISIQNFSKRENELVEKIASQETKKYLPSEVQYKKYESKPYNSLANAINIHSWFPFYYFRSGSNIFGYSAMPGLTLLSQNLHSTLVAEAKTGYRYGRNYSELSFTYKGLFPVFQMNMFFRDSLKNVRYYTSTDRVFQCNTSVYVPFNFSRGDKLIRFTPQLLYRFENRFYRYDDVLKQYNTNKIGYSLSFSAYQKPTPKHLSPQYGLMLFYQNFRPINSYRFSPQQLFSAAVYLPGLLKHNSIKLEFNRESQQVKNLFNATLLGPIRGFAGQTENELNAMRYMNVYSVDYMLPLAYPDITMLKVIYLKRLQADLFYDLASASVYNGKQFVNKTYSSVGIEFTAECRFFFIPFPVNPGVRVSYLNAEKKLIPEILLGIDLNNF